MNGVLVNLESINGKEIPAVTSLQVAENFGKNHKDVLRDIRVTIEKCSSDFTERNFALSEYEDSTGRALPMYLMTKNGFTMVAMAYTTPEAMRFKEAYIAEFDRMEEELRQAVPQQTFDITSMTIAIFNAAGIVGNQQALALDKIVRKKTGDSPLMLADVQLVAPTKNQILTPTEIGKVLGGKSAKVINSLLLVHGYQKLDPGTSRWVPTDFGHPYAVMLDVGKRHSDGTPVRQLKWDASIVEALRKDLDGDTNK